MLTKSSRKDFKIQSYLKKFRKNNQDLLVKTSYAFSQTTQNTDLETLIKK